MKAFIYFLVQAKIKLENFLGSYFLPLKWFYQLRNFLVLYDEKEKELFCTKMPLWYVFCEKAFIMRGIRVLMGLWLIFQNKIVIDGFQYFMKNDLNLNIDFFLSETWSIINFYLVMLFLCFFFFFTVLKFCLGFIYFRELTFNSPFSIKQCIIWGFHKVCRVSFMLGILGYGSSSIDYRFERAGHVGPFSGFFQSATHYALKGKITPKMGSLPSKDLVLLDGDEFIGAFLVKKMQENTLQVEQNHHQIFQERQQGVEIRRVSELVRKQE